MISERDVYTAVRRLSRLHFEDQEALAAYQREKLQHYLRQQLPKSPYYHPWLGRHGQLIPMMDGAGSAKHFSRLCTVPGLQYHQLFAQAAAGQQTEGESPYCALLHPARHQGWALQVYDRQELLRKLAHFLAGLLRNAGSNSIRIAHIYFFGHLMQHLPPLSQTDYRLYNANLPYAQLKAALLSKEADILIAPQGVLLRLAQDKLSGEFPLQPTQIYCENAMLGTRDRLILRKAFGEFGELCTQGGRLLAMTCEKGGLHLAENHYFFELKWIDAQHFIPVYTDFNAHTLPVFRFQSGCIFTAADAPCTCGSAQQSVRRREILSEDVLWLPGATGGYRAVFAAPLEDFAASCLPWDREYRIVQERLDHLVFYSEDNPQSLQKREGRLKQVLAEQGIVAEKIRLSYAQMHSPHLFADTLARVQRQTFPLPTQCYFL